MKKLQLAKMVAGGALLLGLSLSANAGVFTFTSTDSSVTASGWVNTDNGTATAGSMVVSGSADNGVWSLYNIGDIPANDGVGVPSGAYVVVGGAEAVDNWFYVNPGYQVDYYGLLFVNSSGALLNLCSEYTPWDGGSVGSVYNNVSLQDGIKVGGTMVCSTPDGGMTVALLGSAMMGLAALRRKLFC